MVLAQDTARNLGHRYIGTEHLLSGLAREEEGLASRVLESFDVTADLVVNRAVAIVGREEGEVTGKIPFTPRTRKVLELGLREALTLGHNYVGTEHVLLGLVREGGGVGMRILAEQIGEDAEEQVRREVVRMLNGPGRRSSPFVPKARAEDGSEVTQTLLRQAIRTPHRSALFALKVRHREAPGLSGVLVSYDWDQDRCSVQIDGPSGVLGEFSAPLADLVIDRR